MESKKVLIIGGAGYIGSVLTNYLLEEGYSIKLLDNLSFGDLATEKIIDNSRLELIKSDYRNIEIISKAVQNVENVIHLGGIVGDPACSLDESFTLSNNYFSTISIANICKYYKVKKFLFASSCSVYGQSEELLDENSNLSPVSLYAKDKILSEKGILALRDENFTPTVLRFSTLFGWSPRMRFDLLVNILTANAFINNEFMVSGGNQWRPFIHTKDIAKAISILLKQPIEKISGEIFNIGSNQNNYQIIEIAKIVKKFFPNAKMNIVTQDTDLRNYRVNFDKLEKAIGFIPSITIEEGIQEIIKNMNFNQIKEINLPKYNNYLKTKEILSLNSDKKML